MFDNNLNASTAPQVGATSTNPAFDYSVILRDYDLKYKDAGLYWLVGEIGNGQGWIINLSAIHLEVEALLYKIIPVLIRHKTPFKVVKDREWAKDLLYGNFGYNELGKVIHIYPHSDALAINLARELIKLTSSFRGPDVPTDFCLGGIVYTRYGGFVPIIQRGPNGEDVEFIQDHTGALVKDSYTIPFQLPTGVTWPFGEITTFKPFAAKKILKGIYKPLSVLKSDTRGDVLEALYLKGLLRVGHCVIKVGKKNMIVDEVGRDIRDRLLWQQELQQKLGDVVPTPRIIDLFEDEGNVYLAMEYIKGTNLYDRIVEINTGYKTFFQLSFQEKSELIEYLFAIINIVEKMHERGYVHRDIAPGNFLIDSKKKLFVIDMELAYRISEDKLLPPYELGTAGFMSPEQMESQIPTVKEDIYGLGALMIVIFTGLSPVKFDMHDYDKLAKNISFFIDHSGMAGLISKCLSLEPEDRPELSFIKGSLERYWNAWRKESSPQTQRSLRLLQDIPLLKSIIPQAIEGLCNKPMPISKDRWMSRSLVTDGAINTYQKQFSPYAGLHTGMGGVLYVLSKAKRLGYDIQSAKKNCDASWGFIERDYLPDPSHDDPGLYGGKAGIALILTKSIETEMLADNEVRRHQILTCLGQPTEFLGLASGVSGQGIVYLQCSKYLGIDTVYPMLQSLLSRILNAQRPDGSLMHSPENIGRIKSLPLGLSLGSSGIITFLLSYHVQFPEQRVESAIKKALKYLLDKTNDGKDLFNPRNFYKLVNKELETGDERTGFALACIRAYEVLKDPYYKQVAESILSSYPDFVVNNNFSQDGGLATLGELYCEAWRVFHTVKWKERAEQIAQVYAHTYFSTASNGFYWLMKETNKPTADLIVGNSGIIHFLLNCHHSDDSGYILLS